MSKADYMNVDECAAIIGCHPHSIRVQAQRDPAKLGFPVSVIGRRVRIPREGFKMWYTGQNIGGNNNGENGNTVR